MKILIADDHTIVRKGLVSILTNDFADAAVVEAENSADLVKKAAKDKWDIIISDISMPGRSGLEVVEELKVICPKTPILFLSSYTSEQYAVRAFKAGAAGFLTKKSAVEELVKAVEHITGGKKYITPEIAELLAASYDHNKPVHENLSDREFEILKLIGSGKTITEIAKLLFLTNNTVGTYRARILKKMDMTSTAQLVHYTIAHHLIS